MPRELIWRAVAAAIFAADCGWSATSARWALAGITGFLGFATLVFLGLGFIAWRRGLLKGHS
jgi:hypothetical protein